LGLDVTILLRLAAEARGFRANVLHVDTTFAVEVTEELGDA
jgi:3'-phosphoadenosine 5'-phosphosulfate sulfotransferase (PAPS reductase)/FAD synthetase